MKINNSVKKTQTGIHGFTLIEMLVVVMIIVFLISFIAAIAGTATKRSYIAKAKAEVRELTKAWKAYWLTYGKWPNGYDNNIISMDASAMKILQGNNPQRLKFMDVGSEITTSGFKDPWGTLYRMNFNRPGVQRESEYFKTAVYFPSKKRFDYE